MKPYGNMVYVYARLYGSWYGFFKTSRNATGGILWFRSALGEKTSSSRDVNKLLKTSRLTSSTSRRLGSMDTAYGAEYGELKVVLPVWKQKTYGTT